jgi:hypothetical protein
VSLILIHNGGTSYIPPNRKGVLSPYEGEQKKCNYCVWIEDEVLSHFSASKDFKAILDSHRRDWSEWVKEKIDQKDFRNVVLKFDKEGHKEMDLDKMDKKLSME